jgi:hypothetical protein
MELISLIEKAINERGTAAIMKERLVLIKEQAEVVDKQLVDTQKENATLKAKVTEIEGQIAYWTKRNEFVEGRGTLFKRKSEGDYHKCVYCPKCFGPMTSLLDKTPFRCGICKTGVSFTGHDLTIVMGELPK